MRQFSRRGERVTDFERALIAETTEPQSQFLELARRVGIDALVAFFDEFGSEKIHVPTREFFFESLFRKQRDADIVRRMTNGENAEDIARLYGISTNSVWRIGVTQRAGRRGAADMVDGAP